MVLREPIDEDDVWLFASEFNLEKTHELSAPERQGIVRQVSWATDQETRLHYAVDHLSACSFIVVEDGDSENFSQLVDAVMEVLDPWTIDELLTEAASYATSGDPRAFAQAVIRLGVGAPNDYNGEVFNRILAAMHSPETWVRKAAIWATTYSRWPQFLPLLSEVADKDPDQEIRSEARLMVDFDNEPENEP
jgi:hypothetical protein